MSVEGLVSSLTLTSSRLWVRNSVKHPKIEIRQSKMAYVPLPSRPNQRVVIVGAGIVGSCVAAILSERLGSNIVLVDRDIRELPGSTGHAPGFVGQYNELPVLTELAKRSVKYYQNIDGGFEQVGGLEVGQDLEKRFEGAQKEGLEAKVLNKEEILQIAGAFVRDDIPHGPAGVLFPFDGTANAITIAYHQQHKAASNGATLLNADVKSIIESSSGNTRILQTSRGRIDCHTVILCTGIWASQLFSGFTQTVVPVAHPYSYSLPNNHQSKTPFIRWPSKHVYARDHGRMDGLGSYAHAPIHVHSDQIGETAYGQWEPSFDDVLKEGYSLLPQETAERFKGGQKFNGLFSVTPDGLPLVGKIEDGLWCAVAVWVTHAAGCAGLLADMFLGTTGERDAELRMALDPKRFEGEGLENKALAKYNDIYNKVT
ncbi:N,N-dimethylglycine oxidase [Cryptococcus neoformans C23]|nr:N,N-dimethylglycine oxidase [Cryptococcus neoformans var. grubii AD2-60a]OWZ44402.1 N,N-dimethylglycine oxidase [Cryptococcus neoformans var. grubii C23]OXC84715.1 N,N-dimethylglycine oxidase [Cryptococcus neoformans var. grubii AD1-7a]OXG50228.1 N,N-dimethylglycine oxidase [Cryptococcus neoformans var. grubii Th84]OXG82073.1 N,N-dimethylglycine oxidase [Cryptococcus neoformans var. grubii MW-RSA36]OXG88204.1 N,N-dimethylglycine oxidase [Cryptococcus neoformans var. grubii D17-1]OXG96829.1